MSARVFIYCDDPSHSARRVAVTNFVHIGEGRWTERFASRDAVGDARFGQRDSGATLIGNERPAPGWTWDEDLRQSETRSRYRLVCRKCKPRPIAAREERLFAVLNAFRRDGVSEVSLTLLAASLQRQSEGS